MLLSNNIYYLRHWGKKQSRPGSIKKASLNLKLAFLNHSGLTYWLIRKPLSASPAVLKFNQPFSTLTSSSRT